MTNKQTQEKSAAYPTMLQKGEVRRGDLLEYHSKLRRPQRCFKDKQDPGHFGVLVTCLLPG